MRTIGLFGGSFDPPHVAHQRIARHALAAQAPEHRIDELWLVPVFTHPGGKRLARYADRVAMCELAAAAIGPRAKVSRAEAELAAQPGFVANRTADLLDHLAAAHPAARFRLIVGADVERAARRWHRWAEVIARAPLIVFGRAEHSLSATAIRAAIARGERPRALLPRGVLRYVAEHGLYL